MKLEHYSVEELERQVRAAVERGLPGLDYKLYFFGSRVSETNREGSDIDIGIEAERKLTAAEKFAVEDELEKICTLYSFDLVDFNDTDVEFCKQALKNAREIKVA